MLLSYIIVSHNLFNSCDLERGKHGKISTKNVLSFMIFVPYIILDYIKS
jgi:hypothetical protein